MTSTDYSTQPPFRPSFSRSRSTCLAGPSIKHLHHQRQARPCRPRADTVFLKRRFVVHQYSDDDGLSSASILDSLDLSIPFNRHLERLRSILEGSIEEALEKLQCYQRELSTDDEESYDSSEDPASVTTTADDSDADTGEEELVELPPSASTDSPHSPTLTSSSSSFTNKKNDTETLQAFLNDVYNLLSSIRKDIHEQLPSLPQLPSCMPSTFDKRAVLEALASNYEKAQEVLFQLSLYSPLSVSLPEFPATLAASISSAAKGALAAASSSTSGPQTSYPFASTSSTSFPFEEPAGESSSSAPSTTLSSSTNSKSTTTTTTATYTLPTPPLSAIRAFLTSESKRLSLKLPSLPHLKRPSLQDWSNSAAGAVSSSALVKQTLHNAYNEASHFVHDEKEKLKDLLHDETEKLRIALSHGKSRLLEFHELPAQWKNNKYILSGYRFIPADRPGELILSAFKWHNETVNIYTHFLPAAYIIYYIFQVFPHTPLGDPTLNTFYDRSANLAFLLASLICLLLSAAWHLAAGCGTYSVFHSCATLDYLGISALISTSIISLTHAAFRCDPAMDLAYNLTTAIFGALGLYLPWKPWFNDREHKNVRIGFFVLLSCVGAAPIVHMCLAYGGRSTWQFYSPVLYSLLAYKVGLLFYALDFPEALRPGGIFDTLAHSHQFWHCAIIVAIALHWQALKGMNEAGLQGYSCTGRDPYEVQYFMKWLHKRDEL